MHLSADTSGIDEPPRAPIQLDELVNGIASRTCELVDDDAFAACKGVEQRRLADVRTPHQGDATRAARGQRRGHGRFGGQDLHDDVEEIAGTASVQSRNGVGLAQSEAPQVRSVCFLERRVDLIRGEDNRLLLRPKHLDDAFIGGGHADGRIKDEHDSVR